MASTSKSNPMKNNHNNQEEHNASTSYFKKTVTKREVTLREWWLVKSDDDNEFQGKRLAVAGFTWGEEQAKRVFHSAPIINRDDVFTLETSDGVIVIFQGFINRQKTIENGFSTEVFDHFLFGFPPYWEEYAEKCFKRASFSASTKAKDSGNLDNDASENIPPHSSSCPKDAINLVDDASENIPPQGNEDGMNSGVMNFSTASLSQDPEGALGCNTEEEVTCDESVISPTVGNSCILKQPSNNCVGTTMFSAVQTVAEVNDVAAREVEMGSMDVMPSNSGRRKCSRHLGDFSGKNHKAASGCSVKKNNKELTPHVVDHQEKRRLEKRSHLNLQAEVDTPQVTLQAASRVQKKSENSESKEKTEQLSVKRGGSSMKKAKRKITFDRHVTPITRKSREEKGFLSPESLSFKRSRSGRLLLPPLDFWRNQIPIYDGDRNITGILQESQPSRGSKSEPQKKQKRRR